VAPDNPNHEHCTENAARLQAAGVEVLELPFLPYREIAGERVAISYLNFYVCNGAVVVPVAGAGSGGGGVAGDGAAAETDAPALEIIGGSYPGREVVPVPGGVLAYGGGGPHCITQQVPATAV